MTYVYSFDHPHGKPLDDVKAIVGGKGANLALMTSELGLPVPPGFTISTDACRAYLEGGWPEGLDEEIRAHIERLEDAVGRRYADPDDPLLVSVRSGAPISMPGMMDTVLNLGLNDESVRGLADVSGDPEFAAACRDRLLKMYREIVGVEVVPDDPWEQLRGAVEAVFRSWNGDRARAYRAHEGLPDDLGTAVNVQTMVFGNLGSDSATGVIFTRDPASGERVLYGDVLFDAQGEDVVAGTHDTEPIAVLDDRMPELAAELRSYADTLERYYADVCDIEFTIERGRLWMLQNRIGKRSPQAALRIAVEMAEDEDFPLSRAEAVARVAGYLADPPKTSADRNIEAPVAATGLGASPGLAAGEIATSADAALAMAEGGRAVILVRPETSPDDVHGIARAAGILTSTGGLASHAAVVARGWGIPAVVGAEAVVVEGDTVTIGPETFGPGDTLTIDGGAGEVFVGSHAGEAVIVPEAVKLLAWAEELGIEIGQGEERSGEVAPSDEPAAAGDEVTDLALRALAIKGFVMADGFAPAIQKSVEETTAILDGLVEAGLAELAGMYRLTDEGKAAAEALMESDRNEWGLDAANAELDAFLPLDERMKQIVTAWQMREVDGEPVMNDHTDEEYDAGVLADFAVLAADADAWVRPLADGLARLALYGTRLEAAAGMVATGEHDYIASPRLDSYHNVWFELHEDLIRLAGRTREEETAAGRA